MWWFPFRLAHFWSKIAGKKSKRKWVTHTTRDCCKIWKISHNILVTDPCYRTGRNDALHTVQICELQNQCIEVKGRDFSHAHNTGLCYCWFFEQRALLLRMRSFKDVCWESLVWIKLILQQFGKRFRNYIYRFVFEKHKFYSLKVQGSTHSFK
jgi:hypothetical protein